VALLMLDLGAPVFFGGWAGLFHAAVIGGLAYLGFILLLHAFGKAMLLETSAASLVVTTALGSGLAAIVLVEKISLVEGLTGFFTIMLLQTTFIWASARSKTFKRILREPPVLVYFHGRFFEQIMDTNGISRADIYAAMRKSGLIDEGEVGAVTFESNGALTAVRRSRSGSYSALAYVKDFPPEGLKAEKDPLEQLPHR
jgi:uncharacterized membrane protein YcaP (DUF421 family)